MAASAVARSGTPAACLGASRTRTGGGDGSALTSFNFVVYTNINFSNNKCDSLWYKR